MTLKFFVASGHPFAPVIRPPKRNSKKVFFGTLYFTYYIIATFKEIFKLEITLIDLRFSRFN